MTPSPDWFTVMNDAAKIVVTASAFGFGIGAAVGIIGVVCHWLDKMERS